MSKMRKSSLVTINLTGGFSGGALESSELPLFFAFWLLVSRFQIETVLKPYQRLHGILGFKGI